MDEEEDRDKEILNQTMKKFSKIWKQTFSRYANQAYSTKTVNDFDLMKAKNKVISLAEVTNIMKENKMLYVYISKDEISSMIRLIASMKSKKDAEM